MSNKDIKAQDLKKLLGEDDFKKLIKYISDLAKKESSK